MGGSVIDTAKSVCAGYYLEDIWDLYSGKRSNKALSLYTILTISATGSEMNCFAVLTNEVEKQKWAFANPLVFPKVSIIDPTIQNSLPWNQTANGAADALAHIMEYYFLYKGEETALALNESLMNSVIKVTDKLIVNEKDYESRANLAWAATLALNGISASMNSEGDWATHGIEHGVSAVFPKVAHGTGLAIIFPAWIEYVKNENPKTFERFAKNIWNCDNIDKAILKMKEKFKEWKISVNLRELGIKEENLDEIAQNSCMQGELGSLKKLTKEDVRNILDLCF